MFHENCSFKEVCEWFLIHCPLDLDVPGILFSCTFFNKEIFSPLFSSFICPFKKLGPFIFRVLSPSSLDGEEDLRIDAVNAAAAHTSTTLLLRSPPFFLLLQKQQHYKYVFSSPAPRHIPSSVWVSLSPLLVRSCLQPLARFYFIPSINFVHQQILRLSLHFLFHHLSPARNIFAFKHTLHQRCSTHPSNNFETLPTLERPAATASAVCADVS